MLGRMIGMFLVASLIGCASEPEPVDDLSPVLPSHNECLAADPQNCGQPLVGDLEHWTWFPVPESQCLDGTSTGFGVRLGSEPNKVLFYLEGGGACYNTWSCENIFASQFNADDFGEGKQVGIFNQADLDNPFRTWTYNLIYRSNFFSSHC